MLSLCSRIVEVPRVPELRRCRAGKCLVPAFPARFGSLALGAMQSAGHPGMPLRAVFQTRPCFAGRLSRFVQADRRLLLETKGQHENCLQH